MGGNRLIYDNTSYSYCHVSQYKKGDHKMNEKKCGCFLTSEESERCFIDDKKITYFLCELHHKDTHRLSAITNSSQTPKGN